MHGETADKIYLQAPDEIRMLNTKKSQGIFVTNESYDFLYQLYKM